MKKIKLTQNKCALVDDEDYEYLNQWKWCVNICKYTSYAARSVREGKNRIHITMHRLIINCPNGMEVDHKDGNGLNNQKENLRICTRTQNQYNSRIRKDNTSGIKGVSWHKNSNKWRVNININNKYRHLGSFSNINDAKRVYEKAAKEYFGEFYCGR